MFMSLIQDGAIRHPYVAAISWEPHPEMGGIHPAGKARVLRELPAPGLVFMLSKTALTGRRVLASHALDIPEGPMIMRIDEVCFPVGAVAHKHSHAAAGIRHLVRGALRIEAEDHTQTMQVNDSWFEAAGSPVRAVALHEDGVTSFIRAMVLPARYAGKSTFSLVNPDDAELPRLQVTHRHVDLQL